MVRLKFFNFFITSKIIKCQGQFPKNCFSNCISL